MAGGLHDFRARIVVFIDPVAEAHEPDVAVLVFYLGNEIGNFADVADFGEHFQHGFVGAAMRRAPQAGDAGGDAGERVGAG